MPRFGILTLVLAFWLQADLAAQTADKPAAKKPDPPKPSPAFAELLKGSADDFIKEFDKEQKGFLAKKDLPPRLAGLFDRWDKNNDGKLDKKEVTEMLQALRRQFGLSPAAPKVTKEEVDRVVDQILARMDANKDGKISRDEARGNIAQSFNMLDTNKDGFLDRAELRVAATRFLEKQKRNPAPGNSPTSRPSAPAVNVPDFDALDLNADGRLTRDELKGTPYADLFDQMDTNKDGKIDRKEFAAYFKREAEKKEAKK
jgi:Ca2+-binding EF-hand superfamily protein